MANISMKLLLEAGVHFGHQTNKWNPKMKPYIFGARNGIYIIDLQQTVGMFHAAYDFVADMVGTGGELLFVGTKKQSQESVKEESERCGMPYVNQRWLGGMLTNFNTINKRIERLNLLEKMFSDDSIKAFPKNVNVSVAMSLAAGMDTDVELFVDPAEVPAEAHVQLEDLLAVRIGALVPLQRRRLRAPALEHLALRCHGR